jgi:TonB family protein
VTALAAVLLLLAHSSGALPSGEEPLGSPDSALLSAEAEAETSPCGMPPFKPEKLEGPRIQYTSEALAARVEGTMLVKCVITQEGRVRKCKVLRELKHLNKSVVSALEASRYKPVLFQGKPIELSYDFTLNFKLPESSTGTGPRQKRRNAEK